MPTEGTVLGLTLLFLVKVPERVQLHVNLRICSSCVSNTFCPVGKLTRKGTIYGLWHITKFMSKLRNLDLLKALHFYTFSLDCLWPSYCYN